MPTVTSRFRILSKLVFTAANCIIENKIKNYNSLVSSKAIEKRKSKKFSQILFLLCIISQFIIVLDNVLVENVREMWMLADRC